MPYDQVIVVYYVNGQPQYFGPFDTSEEASEHAEAVPISDYHLAPITAPGDLTSLPRF